MSRVLVTGGTGFLGLEVVRALRAQGDAVRVLARGAAPSLRELGAEQVLGDVVREGDLPEDGAGAPRAVSASLVGAMEGVDALVHLAGFVSRDPADGQRMMRLHVDGTRRALEAAARAGVRRVVVASTSGTSAVSRSPVALDERAPYAHALLGSSPYHLSNIYKEAVAREHAGAHGLELVIVAPALLLGPGDVRASSTGELDPALRGAGEAPPGGVSFLDVRDAAPAIAASLHRGRAGERYFLGGADLTYAELYAKVARLAGRPPRLARPFARLVERARRRLDPGERASPHELYWYCADCKARDELGLVTRDPLETLADTIRDRRARAA